MVISMAIFFDTETTGIENARLVELSYKKDDCPIVTIRCKPPHKIECSASAVNGIGNWEVKDLLLFKDMPEYKDIKDIFEDPDQEFVAHNIEFDIGVLEAEGIHVVGTVHDTKEMARKKWPKAEKHNLQYLRFWLDIRIEGIAHTSAGDVMVLEEVWNKLHDNGGDLAGEIDRE